MTSVKFNLLLVMVLVGTGVVVRADDVPSPCDSREPSLSTCSEFADACVAYFKSPKAPNDTLRDQMGDMGVHSCVGWKDQCLKTGLWRGPNCVIINIERR